MTGIPIVLSLSPCYFSRVNLFASSEHSCTHSFGILQASDVSYKLTI